MVHPQNSDGKRSVDGVNQSSKKRLQQRNAAPRQSCGRLRLCGMSVRNQQHRGCAKHRERVMEPTQVSVPNRCNTAFKVGRWRSGR